MRISPSSSSSCSSRDWNGLDSSFWRAGSGCWDLGGSSGVGGASGARLAQFAGECEVATKPGKEGAQDGPGVKEYWACPRVDAGMVAAASVAETSQLGEEYVWGNSKFEYGRFKGEKADAGELYAEYAAGVGGNWTGAGAGAGAAA